MVVEIAKTGLESYLEAERSVDKATEYIKWCFKQSDVELPVGLKNPQDFYNHLKTYGKRVYRGKLKAGDIVLIKAIGGDSYVKIGLFASTTNVDEKFVSVELDTDKVKLVDKIRFYTDCVFVRPGVEDEDIKPKKKKQ